MNPRRVAPCMLSLSIVAGCAESRLTGPQDAPAITAPASAADVLERAGLQGGPALVAWTIDRGAPGFPVAGIRSGASTGSDSELARPVAASSVQAEPEPFFTVHPNGGTRTMLRQKEIRSGDPTQQVGFQIFCDEPGIGFTPANAEVDSLYHENIGTPTAGHGADHDFSNGPTGRPLGTYDETSGPTTGPGIFGPTEYTANIASGLERVVIEYRITQPGSACNDGVQSRAVFHALVEVPGLQRITTHPDVSLFPPTSHPADGFWFLAGPTIAATIALGSAHRSRFGSPILLTAASLVQGGINDVNRNWAPPGHWEHRIGTDIDIDEQADNDPFRIEDIVKMGTSEAGFAKCEGHPRNNPNHVHCQMEPYQ